MKRFLKNSSSNFPLFKTTLFKIQGDISNETLLFFRWLFLHVIDEIQSPNFSYDAWSAAQVIKQAKSKEKSKFKRSEDLSELRETTEDHILVLFKSKSMMVKNNIYMHVQHQINNNNQTRVTSINYQPTSRTRSSNSVTPSISTTSSLSRNVESSAITQTTLASNRRVLLSDVDSASSSSSSSSNSNSNFNSNLTGILPSSQTSSKRLCLLWRFSFELLFSYYCKCRSQ